MSSLLRTLFKVLRYLLWRRYVIIPLLLFLGGYFLLSCGSVYVGPSQLGILQVNYGGSSGIRQTPLRTGLHVVIPAYERVHIYPTDLQVLDMSAVKEKSRVGRVTEAIRIQTSDGYRVVVDVSVLYRIRDPYAVMTKIGPGKLYEDSLVIPLADKALRQALGELNSEEFYEGPRRIAQTKLAFDRLKPELAQKGIELVKVLARQITYDQAYQTLIEQRKIQDQMVFKNRAEGAAAKEEAHKREMISTGQAVVKVEIEKGQSEVAKILSDANLQKRSKDADGELLVKTAVATGTELENRALQGAGSQNLVGQKLADVLKGVKVIVVPASGPGSTNPLDVKSLLRQFEVQP